jgi:hypothetical protein
MEGQANYVLYNHLYKTLISNLIRSFGYKIVCILRLLYIFNENRLAK